MEETRLISASKYKKILVQTMIWARDNILSLSKIVFFVSTKMSQNYSKTIKTKHSVLTLGYNQSDIQPRVEKKQSNDFCYIGTVNSVRNLSTMLKAFAKLHALTGSKLYLYVTSAKASDLNNFIDFAVGLNPDAFVFCDNIPRHELLVEIRKFHAGLIYFPDCGVFDNNFPIKLIDYMCAGLITTSTPQPTVCEFEGRLGNIALAKSYREEDLLDSLLVSLNMEFDREIYENSFFRNYRYDVISQKLIKR